MKQINTPEEVSKVLGTPHLKKEKRPKRPGEGRPPTNLSILPDDWQDKILAMSAQGMSGVEIRAKLCTSGSPGKPNWKFNDKLWDALAERETEFSLTVKRGQALCQAWWEEMGRNNLKHSKEKVFETALWFINMKNRFGWKDKQEIDHGITDESFEKYKTLSIDQLKTRLKEIMPSHRVAGLLTDGSS
jgi:hypothetical protein